GLIITTECGRLKVSPGDIAIIPQGFRFHVNLPDGPSRGYVAEIFGTHFQLPDLGPIGANGLASPRDFLVPTAWFEDKSYPGYTIVQKFGGELFTAVQDFSPFNVVAWHGNNATVQGPLPHEGCRYVCRPRAAAYLTTVTLSISSTPHSASSLQINLLRSSTTILLFSSTPPPRASFCHHNNLQTH
ncbi:homogentisate 1,2-dioxygenase-like protein, partial [Trifolium pratense]